MGDADWARIEQLRAAEQYDWRTVKAFRNKEEGGHDQPWLRFLAGDNPTYPEEILRAAYANVCRRLALIAQDEADLKQVYIHHWQQLNPVVTEALIQLTLGAPQIIYNGGLLHCRLRYFDLGNGEERASVRACRPMSRRWSRSWRRSQDCCASSISAPRRRVACSSRQADLANIAFSMHATKRW